MEKYILKSTITEEIKNRRDSFYSLSKSCEKGTPAKTGFYAQAQTLEGILSFLTTIEVKEVDLESEIDRVWDNTSDNFSEDGWKEFKAIAKHFFELGMSVSKAQKEE